MNVSNTPNHMATTWAISFPDTPALLYQFESREMCRQYTTVQETKSVEADRHGKRHCTKVQIDSI